MFGSVVIAVLELAGFVALQDYLDNFGIPIHFSAFVLLELLRWGFYALAFEIPHFISYALAFLIVLSWIAYVWDRSARVVKVRYADASQTGFGRFVDSELIRARIALPKYVPVAQILALFVLGYAFVLYADSSGLKLAESVVSGKPAGVGPNREIGGSVRVDGPSLPTGITGENRRGALVLLWSDDRTVYVTPLHRRPASSGPHRFLDWFALNRDRLTDFKYTREWTSPGRSRVTAQWSSLWFAVAVAVAGTVLLALGYLQSYRRQRGQPGTLRVLKADEALTIAGSAAAVSTVHAVLAADYDVELVERQPDGAAATLWIRRASLAGGVAVETGPASTRRRSSSESEGIA